MTSCMDYIGSRTRLCTVYQTNLVQKLCTSVIEFFSLMPINLIPVTTHFKCTMGSSFCGLFFAVTSSKTSVTACVLQIPKIATFFLGIRPLHSAWSTMTQIRCPAVSFMDVNLHLWNALFLRVRVLSRWFDIWRQMRVILELNLFFISINIE